MEFEEHQLPPVLGRDNEMSELMKYFFKGQEKMKTEDMLVDKTVIQARCSGCLLSLRTTVGGRFLIVTGHRTQAGWLLS